MAGTTRLELATFGVTGRRSNQLNYAPVRLSKVKAGSNAVNGRGFGLRGALFFQPLERPAHELALERAKMVDEELAVEVVDFVLKGAGVKTLARSFERLTIQANGLDFDPSVALDIAVQVGKAQTTLLADLLALVARELGVDQGHGLAVRLMDGHIDDADPLEDANLRGGKPDPLRGVHGIEEVGDEFANGVIHLCNSRTLLAEALRSEQRDFAFHVSKGFNSSAI